MNNSQTNKPIKCLGLEFKNNETCQDYFSALLKEKLANPQFKNIAGFPQATNETILNLSTPPFHTFCPNPWLPDFLESPQNISDDYYRQAFIADISEGKHETSYNIHSYHTKVPYKAIMRYILHYTDPGDIIFDGFCGTGMTGVAAQLCDNQAAIESLSYQVSSTGEIKKQVEKGNYLAWETFAKLGKRKAILSDLSPIATLIAHHYNKPIESDKFEQQAQQVLQTIENECNWLYQTVHSCRKNMSEYAHEIEQIMLGEKVCPDWLTLGRIHHTIWSDVFNCPECRQELVFWEVAVDVKQTKIKKRFNCPHCNVILTKSLITRVWIKRFDPVLQQTIQQVKQIPVIINYTIANIIFQKKLDKFDLILLEKLNNNPIPYWFPTEKLPDGQNTSQAKKSHGFTHSHHFYTQRNLWVLSCLYKHCSQGNLLLLFQSIAVTLASRLVRYNFGNRGNSILPGTLYVPSLAAENNICKLFANKVKKNNYTNCVTEHNLISTQSSTNLQISNNSIDYIFLDPPFGANIMYSELNFLWEAWLQIFTNNQQEAVINNQPSKNLSHYHKIIKACFSEAFRILKPQRWITVVFSNTQIQIWNILQTSLHELGFIIANTTILDKKQGSFKAVTTTTAIKQNIVISAYKPDFVLEQQFELMLDAQACLWEFIEQHLCYLPVIKLQENGLEFINEREANILYNCATNYFAKHGDFIPISNQQFQIEVINHFAERDNMIFRADQVAEYDQKRKKMPLLTSMEIIIYDERSAIDWLQHFLKQQPATRQKIYTQFAQLIANNWKKYEPLIELDGLLALNFMQYDGEMTVPKPIYNYLTQHFNSYRHLLANDIILKQRAAKCWYIPNTQQAKKLAQLREKQLLKEFKQYQKTERKSLKKFRLEAIRCGFKQAWAEKNYPVIIEMAEKIPEVILYADEKLLQLCDLARFRLMKK
ncbi:MAG: hypothetical protein KAH84_03365 [Thiomargarita sp.]|nr:hypothetical protein [Thiomargarita sp.]